MAEAPAAASASSQASVSSPTAASSPAPDPTSPAPDTTPPARLRDLLSYLGEHRAVLGVVVVVSFLGAGLSLAQPLMVNRAIGSVGSGALDRSAVGLLVALVVAAGLVGAVQQYLLERTAEGVVLGARRRLLAKLLRLPVREYDVRRTGDLVSRVGSDTTLVRSALTGGLVDALGGSIVFVGAIVAMALLDLVLLGITLGVILVAVAAVVVASGRIQTLTKQSQEAVGRVAAGVERALSGLRTVRASGATEREGRRLEEDAQAAYVLGVRVARIGAILWPVSGLAVQGAFLAVLGVGGYRVAAGTLTVADLVTFILFLFMMLMPLGQGFSAVVTVRSALGALARIQEVLALPSEDDDEGDLDGVRAPVATVHAPAVELAGVSFSYGDEPVLRDVTLTVPRGSITAVVGPSGAGKTTLLALLERFYEPDAGVIRFEGADVRALPRAVLRSRIGYVEQDAPALAGSIRDNLLLAAPGADDAACRRALDAVNLLDRVDQHPAGLDAVLGDDGVGLSGGERQRLAIARALIGGAPLLLLDEPTASLDGRNEQAMREAIRSAAEQRTVLIVAHRLATVADADQIVVMEAGRVVATGTHAELLGTSPLYRELAEHQLLV
ncbi:ABC transporter ATP-binding protein [Cellulomonas marina]|uniref:ATP-binding cassette, subfamily B n=1 Tax=Cellulomonas marina TaxID=988821 RepID=A0A1I0X9Y3_9CELL|nr:ABC transporter ATP-binding protein [Cellulomonas marina]GIG29480.1 ABC transporter [Cellulomonas marina]SFA96753.1 ATP-binding cassette, subfamily B [Cellulomonas marina]